MVGNRVVIPSIYRKRLLKQIHWVNPEIERSKMIAILAEHRDIKSLVQNCDKSAVVAKMPTKTLLHPWPKPFWQHLHTDYVQLKVITVQFQSTLYKKWPEIISTKSITTKQTIQILREVFARFGLPEVVVSDSGTQFKSAQFEEFRVQNGIQHICSRPYYPMSNRQAGRFVDTFKRSLGKLKYT